MAGEWYAITTCSRGVDLRPGASIVIETAKALDEEGLVALFAVVVMPDHCHLVFELRDGATLADVMQLLKGRSSHAINRVMGRRGALWQRGFYEHLVRSPDEGYAAWWYVLNNPVRRGWVTRWEDYPHTYTVPYPEERVTGAVRRPW